MRERLPDLAAIGEAHARIAQVVRRTPLWAADLPTPYGPLPVFLKLEHMQVSGSFKARGAFNAVLRLLAEGVVPEAGLAIASGGNAGIAAAMACRHAGVPLAVFMPTGSPQAKVDRLRAIGADVQDGGPTHVDTHRAVAAYTVRTGAGQLHPYDTSDMVAGAGTLALELSEVEHGSVLVAVGGGGLMAGIAVVGKARGFRTVAIEPVGAPSLNRALAAGRPVPVAIDTIAVDSLGARVIGRLAFEAANQCEVQSVTVTDQQIIDARNLLWTEFRLFVENSAGAVVAALNSGAWVPDVAEAPPVLIICGANLEDPVQAESSAQTRTLTTTGSEH